MGCNPINVGVLSEIVDKNGKTSINKDMGKIGRQKSYNNIAGTHNEYT